MKRRGFTLIELMIAFSILVVVASELVIVTRETFHLWSTKMWEIDFALKMRTTRERILFQAVPYSGGPLYAGLISSTNINKVGRQMVANFQMSSGSDQPIERGMAPQNVFPQFQVEGIDDGSRQITDTYVANPLFFVSVATTLKTYDRKDSNRVERIAIPVWDKYENLDGTPWEYFMDVQPGDIQWKF